MELLALGLNHKTAPLEIRERLAFGPDVIVGALRSLVERPAVNEAVILSTCNRTEIYCAIVEGGLDATRHWLSSFHGLQPESIAPAVYSHRGLQAVQHLLRVSCGMDSMVLGEPQILGQVKAAFNTANQAAAT